MFQDQDFSGADVAGDGGETAEEGYAEEKPDDSAGVSLATPDVCVYV